VVIAVGHSERCNPVIQTLNRLKIEPKFIEAIRISPYPFRSTDIGVILDVMIHDIDIILSLVQQKVSKVDAIGANVLERKNEDICQARIFFTNGCVASLTASRMAIRTTRKIRIFGEQEYLSMDFIKKTCTAIKVKPEFDVINWIQKQKDVKNFNPLNVNWKDFLSIEEIDVDDVEPVRLEQESFINSVLNKDVEPQVSGHEALSALKCAERIRKSLKKI
jgi:predicted dehydrogenase